MKKNVIWTLSNMASKSSEAVDVMQSLKIHIRAVEFMRIGSDELKEQCLWLLPNMSADSATVRSELLQTDLIEQIISIVKKEKVSVKILENVCWLISCICRDPTPSSISKVILYFIIVEKVVWTL